jgi:hypothetical protein
MVGMNPHTRPITLTRISSSLNAVGAVACMARSRPTTSVGGPPFVCALRAAIASSR